MFCEKCGAQLPDTAMFCNKCGNTLRKNGKKTSFAGGEKNKRLFGILAGVILLVVVIVIAAVFSGRKGRTDISETAEVENMGEAVENWVEDVLDTVQIYSLYGTWTDSYGAISFTFSEDGRLRISGLEDTLSVEAFTFSEVDDDTLQLKVESDVPIVGVVGMNMDYEIEGDTMTVSIAGKELKLVKVE